MSSATVTPVTASTKTDEFTASHQPEKSKGGRYRWTQEEYRRVAAAGLFDDKQVELLDGEIWVMPPQLTPHATAIRRTSRTLRAVFGDGFVTEPQLPIAISNWSEPEPDVTVTHGTAEDFADHHPTPAEIALLVEVSDSTLRKDRGRKAKAYARAGIKDYWIVNLVDGQVEVFREPTPEGVYQDMKTVGPQGTISPLAQLENDVRVADLMPPVTNNEQI